MLFFSLIPAKLTAGPVEYSLAAASGLPSSEPPFIPPRAGGLRSFNPQTSFRMTEKKDGHDLSCPYEEWIQTIMRDSGRPRGRGVQNDKIRDEIPGRLGNLPRRIRTGASQCAPTAERAHGPPLARSRFADRAALPDPPESPHEMEGEKSDQSSGRMGAWSRTGVMTRWRRVTVSIKAMANNMAPVK
jgi:hypothetical protein